MPPKRRPQKPAVSLDVRPPGGTITSIGHTRSRASMWITLDHVYTLGGDCDLTMDEFSSFEVIEWEPNEKS